MRPQAAAAAAAVKWMSLDKTLSRQSQINELLKTEHMPGPSTRHAAATVNHSAMHTESDTL